MEVEQPFGQDFNGAAGVCWVVVGQDCSLACGLRASACVWSVTWRSQRARRAWHCWRPKGPLQLRRKQCARPGPRMPSDIPLDSIVADAYAAIGSYVR